MRAIAFRLLSIGTFCCCGLAGPAQPDGDRSVIYFPDRNFKDALVAEFDINGDQDIDPDEAAAVHVTVDCHSQDIADITGIGYFVNAPSLDCRNNQLTFLPDLSGLINLKQLNINQNNLNTITDLGIADNLTDEEYAYTLDCGVSSMRFE